MAFGGILASIAPSLIGGLLGNKGQRDANQANLQIAREQMAFQERMSSTAHQRAAKDLEQAGLNRILALGKPASSPAGATAVMQNEKAIMATHLKELALLSAQTAKAQAETRAINQNTQIKSPVEDMASLLEQGTKVAESSAISTAKDLGQNIATKMLDLVMPDVDLNGSTDKKSNFYKDPKGNKHKLYTDKNGDVYYIKNGKKHVMIRNK